MKVYGFKDIKAEEFKELIFDRIIERYNIKGSVVSKYLFELLDDRTRNSVYDLVKLPIDSFKNMIQHLSKDMINIICLADDGVYENRLYIDEAIDLCDNIPILYYISKCRYVNGIDKIEQRIDLLISELVKEINEYLEEDYVEIDHVKNVLHESFDMVTFDDFADVFKFDWETYKSESQSYIHSEKKLEDMSGYLICYNSIKVFKTKEGQEWSMLSPNRMDMDILSLSSYTPITARALWKCTNMEIINYAISYGNKQISDLAKTRKDILLKKIKTKEDIDV